ETTQYLPRPAQPKSKARSSLVAPSALRVRIPIGGSGTVKIHAFQNGQVQMPRVGSLHVHPKFFERQADRAEVAYSAGHQTERQSGGVLAVEVDHHTRNRVGSELLEIRSTPPTFEDHQAVTVFFIRSIASPGRPAGTVA